MAERVAQLWRDWRGVLLFVAVMLVFRSAVADWNQVPSGSMKPGILAGDRIVVDKLAWDLRVPFTDVRITRWSDPARGDVVTFENPLDGRLFVKRVVAVPGDRVNWRHNQLAINGEPARYQPLASHEVSRLPVAGDASRYRFYREELLGAGHVVMLHSEPGRQQRRANPTLARKARDCPSYEAVSAAAGRALAAAVCRCAQFGACATFPVFTVPPGKYWMMGDYRDNSSDSRVIGFVDRARIYGRAHAVAFSVDTANYYMPRFGRFFTELPW